MSGWWIFTGIFSMVVASTVALAVIGELVPKKVAEQQVELERIKNAYLDRAIHKHKTIVLSDGVEYRRIKSPDGDTTMVYAYPVTITPPPYGLCDADLWRILKGEQRDWLKRQWDLTTERV